MEVQVTVTLQLGQTTFEEACDNMLRQLVTQHFGSCNVKAARALKVHRNTIRNRLGAKIPDWAWDGPAETTCAAGEAVTY